MSVPTRRVMTSDFCFPNESTMKILCSKVSCILKGNPEINLDLRPTVKRIYNKWKENGTIHNLNKENSGRQRTGRSEDNIDAVRLNVMADPNISVRKLSAAIRIKIIRIKLIRIKI